MARRVNPGLFRRPTPDLKDVQEALKVARQQSSDFLGRHERILERESAVERTVVPEQLDPNLFVGVEGDERCPGQAPPPPSPPAKVSRGQNRPERISGEAEIAYPSPSAAIFHRRRSHDRPPQPQPLYGEVIVLGTNSSLRCDPISPKMKDRYVLQRQPKATGVSLIVRNDDDTNSFNQPSTHAVHMTLSKTQNHILEFGHDSSCDMFQVGRSADSAIDVVVVDTITDGGGKRIFNSSSTVSRYACRIVCERQPPYTARLYAAAFDTRGQIQLSLMAPTWCDQSTMEHDGLTTNGVALMRPVGPFDSGVSPGQWTEVTIMGNVRHMRDQRSSRIPGEALPAENNVLTDGCLIDLCGITLMWRTAMGLDQGPSDTLLRERRQALNQKSPLCPVNFLTLRFREARLTGANNVQDDDDRHPWIYMACGHVASNHKWRSAENILDDSMWTCPICRRIGPRIALELGQQRAFFVDDGPLTHALVPCGHVTTEETARYWSRVRLPHLASGWTPRCPFCGSCLDPERPFITLIFSYDDT